MANSILQAIKAKLLTRQSAETKYLLADGGKRPQGQDAGNRPAIRAAADWLSAAQDNSVSADGGVARHYSSESGWATSYPETTGYIVPTMYSLSAFLDDTELMARAERMLDFLVRIQMPSGGYQGGVIGASPVVPVTFNTGQILIGLSAGVEHGHPSSMAAAVAAADWLCETQDSDGAWRRFATPFAEPGLKVYETHVAWGLLEAARVLDNSNYGQFALKNIRWALGFQAENGWFDSCCLTDPHRPLTHTIGYVLRGVLEGYRYSQEEDLLAAALRTARALAAVQESDGWIAGRLDRGWRPQVSWACLTGIAQIAICWQLIDQLTGSDEFHSNSARANGLLRRSQYLTGSHGIRGGIRGSHPHDGGYGTYEFLNWAVKFFADSLLLEEYSRR